ncbi:MAG: type IV pilus secretin PilQ, partial [Gammaproteobacteria bacterium]|nr:type IV pilus secretin PilQ [Gammaproteobacteria bacterium]
MRTLTLATSLFFASNLYAENTLEDIAFSSLPGDRVEIRLKFSELPPEPSGYTIEQPARIAIDLMDVKSGLDAKFFPLGAGNTKNVTVIEAGDRTRVIVSMTRLTGYTTRVEDNEMFVLVGSDSTFGQVADIETGVLESAIDEDESSYILSDSIIIEDIDFRRGQAGEGRIVVELSDPGVAVDITNERGDIKVTFGNAHLPDTLRRELDVTDFSTPVSTIKSRVEGDGASITISPTGEYDYLAYQADNIFTVEVKPLAESDAESRRAEALIYKGEKISLNFQDVEVRSVLSLIAEFNNLNLVATDTVTGRITLRLQSVPWDQALDIIMKARGLDKRKDGNVLMIAPAAELAAREKLELESREQIEKLAPLYTEFIEIKYAEAGEILSVFESSGESGSSFFSERGSVVVDERTNSIILTETAEKIQEFYDLLDKLDVPVRQVLIESRIVNAASNFSEAIGVRWGILGFDRINSNKSFVQGGASLETLESIRGSSNGGAIALPGPGGLPDLSMSGGDDLVVDLGVGSSEATSFSIGLMDEFFLLDLELSALETQGQAETIARPKVITADQQEATISSGVEIPYLEAASSGAATVSFKQATLALNVKPQITPDDRIIMELSVQQDSVGAVYGGVPSINSNEVETKVLVNNGETVVLGGIYTTERRDSITKTPILGDIPVLGRLFRRNTKDETKN